MLDVKNRNLRLMGQLLWRRRCGGVFEVVVVEVCLGGGFEDESVGWGFVEGLSRWKDPKAVEEPMPDEDLLEIEGKNLRMKKENYEMTRDLVVDDFTR